MLVVTPSRPDPLRLGTHRFKTEGCAPFPSLTHSFLFFPPPSSPLSNGFPVLVVGGDTPVRAGGVIVELGARRRWPFQREGPNGSALLLEVRLLSSGRARTGRRRRGGSRRPRS
ncbi:hypothetical protein Taro_016739 [Colocasia esculenta]|uniref:Uncharacterized protein n=1 Tax=Colocasia esculenta TaxID=4460 RepID=A0A843UEI2_COLES|nr:hypothetical protein [Colocasia esculenta]